MHLDLTCKTFDKWGCFGSYDGAVSTHTDVDVGMRVRTFLRKTR